MANAISLNGQQWYNITMNKSRFRIMPGETYVVTVGNHNEEISGIDILAILEAAFDEALETSEEEPEN